jgi:DNA-directed RNA polymerase beta' subunit
MVKDTDQKEGLIRMNLMGKRRDQTGRTVIGPDPTLKMGQLAVPEEMADNLTVPVQVTKFNFDLMTNLVNRNRANFVIKKNGVKINLQNALFSKGTRLQHGDVIIRNNKEIVVNNGKDIIMDGDRIRRNGKMLENIIYPHVKEYKLNIGDIVERKLQDGDIVLLNRQPTKLCVKVETGDCL